MSQRLYPLKRYFIVVWLVCLGCEIGHGLAPEEKELGSISGTITFLGSWPESTEEIRIAVYAEYPPADFYSISAFSDPLPIGVSTYDYTVLVQPGTYEWIIVVWRKEGSFWGPESLMGTYYSPSDPSRPGVVRVMGGEEMRGIDIIADFTKIGVLPPELEGIFGEKEG